MLSISYMKSFTETKKLELNLNIEFGIAPLSTVSVSRRKLWNHLSSACSKRWGGNHPILSSYPVLAEKIFMQRWDKDPPILFFILFCFSYKKPLTEEILTHRKKFLVNIHAFSLIFPASLITAPKKLIKINWTYFKTKEEVTNKYDTLYCQISLFQ